MLIVDECHHGAARTWTAVVEHFDARFVLGVSATPERHDGKGLDSLFGSRPLYAYPLRQCIEDGHLVRPVQYAVETGASLDDVSFRCGDFARGDLESAVNTEPRNRVIVDAYVKHATGRRAIAFAVDVAHAHALRDAFNGSGITAATVTGATPSDERRSLLSDFAAGRIDVVTNCNVLTEGFDDPGVSCILAAAPTCSRTRYIQSIGRGLRLAPGKSDAMILDFADNSSRHKLVTVLDLFGSPRRDAKGGDVLTLAAEDCVAAERQRLIEYTKPLSWRLKSVCPWPAIPTLAGYDATESWHDRVASEAQLTFLHALGLDVARELSCGEASWLLSQCRESESTHPRPVSAAQK